VIQQELARQGIQVDLRTLQRAVAPLRRQERARALATVRFENRAGAADPDRLRREGRPHRRRANEEIRESKRGRSRNGDGVETRRSCPLFPLLTSATANQTSEVTISNVNDFERNIF